MLMTSSKQENVYYVKSNFLNLKQYKHFCRIRDGGGPERPPTDKERKFIEEPDSF